MQAVINSGREFNNLISTLISIAAHVVVFCLIKFVGLSAIEVVIPAQENYVDLGYQQFEEVPEVVQSAQPVVKNDQVIQDKTEPAPSQAHEMQDQSSDVAGLQKEVVQKAVATANTNTTTVPYYKIKPKYPKEALESNLEGHVMMKIDILEDGSVENIKVTGGEKISVFESAALRAVSKWKYKSFTDEKGQPIKKQDYLVRVDFKIKDELQATE